MISIKILPILSLATTDFADYTDRVLIMSENDFTLKEIYSGNKQWYKNRGKTITAQEADPETYQLIGLGMEIYNNIGPGFLEAVYQEAFEIELQNNDIAYEREKKLEIVYKNKKLNTFYKADFICMNNIIVELKSIKQITNIEKAQVINYLKATGYHKAILLNFGSSSLQFKRFVN